MLDIHVYIRIILQYTPNLINGWYQHIMYLPVLYTITIMHNRRVKGFYLVHDPDSIVYTLKYKDGNHQKGPIYSWRTDDTYRDSDGKQYFQGTVVNPVLI